MPLLVMAQGAPAPESRFQASLEAAATVASSVGKELSSSRHFLLLSVPVNGHQIGYSGAVMIMPSRGRIWRQLVAALSMAASSALAGQACAQFFEDRSRFDRPRHSPNFFSPFFEQRGSPAQTVPGSRVPYVQQSPADSKAPPPRKVETPQTSEVLVIGDSLADWLA
jgi:hypothetical protein